MSTSARGKVVDAQGADIAGVTVVLDDVSALFDRELARVERTTSGSFTLSYEGGSTGRRLRLRVRIGQHVLTEVKKDDVAAAQLDFGSIPLDNAKEATSVLATLGKGEPSKFTQGNAIQWLADNVDAWDRTSDVIKGASKELYVMQLELDVGPFSTIPSEERPEIVLRFDPPTLSGPNETVRDLTKLDDRIEVLLLEAADRGVVVRMQFPVPTVDIHGLAFVGVVLGLAAGIGLVLLAFGIVASLVAVVVGGFVTAATLGWLGLGVLENLIAAPYERHAKELAEWFFDAQAQGDQHASNVSVRILKTQPYSVTHTKIVSDGQAAVLLGSPFEQVYFDGPTHVIDEPRRGASASKGPIHDVSIGVRGPAVGHFQQVFNTHWNLAVPAEETVPPAPPDVLTVPSESQLPPELTAAESGEFLTSVQVVQTLNGGMFDDKPDGEKGILEAYLRAIHFAKSFIYIENQYFTNEAIAEALIAALKANDKLQLILLVNVEPDMPHYPHWQKGLIQKIASSIPKPAEQFGAFTPWSHAAKDEVHGHPKPRLRANYLHTKTAIIDNDWATVGSANLDGASLDFFQAGIFAPNAILQGGEMRNTETNCVVFEEQVPPGGSAVDALRRRLWAEQLGYFNGDVPNTAATDLDPPTDGDWLRLWTRLAKQKQDRLKDTDKGGDPNQVSPIRVLPYPREPWCVNPKAHLDALGVNVSTYDLVEKGPPSHIFGIAP